MIDKDKAIDMLDGFSDYRWHGMHGEGQLEITETRLEYIKNVLSEILKQIVEG